jgi:RNA polymerase sigma-54 factor
MNRRVIMKLQLVNEQVLEWKMNQSLMQSIQILQLSSMELMEYIKEIEKENPLIEEVNYHDEIFSYRSSSTNDSLTPGEINASELTMYDQLKRQLYTLHIPEELRPIVLFGIDSINENGYLDIDMSLWGEQCQATEEQVDQALHIIQSLEPAGIGARSLSECIKLQLDIREDDVPFLYDLMENHLEWIAEENIDLISLHYDKDPLNVKDLLEQIKACHPKPGHLLDKKIDNYVIPEATIYKEDGKWQLSFYSWSSPKITINEDYYSIKDMNIEKQTANYIKQKQHQIEMIKKAIAYRSSTLERVIQCMLEKQLLFFEHGTHMLKPLTLKDIADELGLHISTISRAISHKYVQTPTGIVPLNFFLQSGIQQNNGSKTAAVAVKQLIAELIEKEDKRKPLSDEKIRKKLKTNYGIKIARRTVMKYREQLQLPSSTKRKEK